ncbi:MULTISPECIES: 4-hydroxy-tetrahydrodipicolinate synthase [Streptomyces]|uniref:4-hydroxy-tetrahydrodipicolinate synthase n=2 Tax=Streptomyces TaxID=1883 RepID=A0A1I6S1V5_9ACTN|nr:MULTISPECIES: 4-hydroxy-tetrahydrodipicolinate synthase [Streptomyces]QKV68185.1 4-hydroxy-tetrahydrodipicolinate synthase [Streptomyces harbinensis]SFS70943.1 4-hydroxy-tetrahydrodipicolinate synthase [Streptomyces harbinensis]
MRPEAPFGRRAAAMITPFTADGALDTEGTARLAVHLVDRGGCDALVLNATTGESQTTTDAEKDTVVRAVVEAVGDRATVIAGVGTSDTRHTVALARAARSAGAHALLVVTPYYSRPTQEAIVHHLATVADATELPVMLYDIPARTGAGTELTADSLRRLAEHPRIRAVKDCAYDLHKSALVMSGTELAYYSGCDELNLPLFALGATGYVSTVANVAGRQVRAVLDAVDAGDLAAATRLHHHLLPLIDAVMMEVPGTVAVKALFEAAGLPGGPVRGPLLPAGAELTGRLVDGLKGALAPVS